MKLPSINTKEDLIYQYRRCLWDLYHKKNDMYPRSTFARAFLLWLRLEAELGTDNV